MKKLFKLLVLALFTAFLITFPGCKKDEITTLYTIYTRYVSNITETTALTGATVTSSEGIDVIARGVCWSTGHDPTIADNLTSDGTGSGNFSSNITSLTPNTTIYVRAYATSSAGTAYGNEITFTTPLTFYPGAGLGPSVSFSVGTKAYSGLGYDSKYDWDGNEERSYYKDFWEWDQATNVWTRKADFPEELKFDFLGFSIGRRGYIVAREFFSTKSSETELWEYDPETNTWTQKASFPSTDERYIAMGFSIGNKGYFEINFYNEEEKKYINEFWEWDQATNIWTKKTDFGGDLRFGAVGFSVGNKGYRGTGEDHNRHKLLKDFWEWDQATDVWTRKADFGGDARSGAVGFSIGNKGYIGTGEDHSNKLLKDFWEWDQATDAWIRKSDLKGTARYGAVGFSIGNKGFIGPGFVDGKHLRDFWEYDPAN